MKKVIWIINLLKIPFWELRYFFNKKIRMYVGVSSYKQYESFRLYPDYMKIGNAKTNVEKVALSYCKGKGLDIGSSKWPLSNSRPIDFTEHENAYIIKETDSCIDYIFASHLIEHLDDIERALSEWKRVLKKNGILFLYVPHPACIMWNTDNNPYHYWNPSPLELVKILEDNLFTVNEYSVLPDGYMSYYIVATNI